MRVMIYKPVPCDSIQLVTTIWRSAGKLKFGNLIRLLNGNVTAAASAVKNHLKKTGHGSKVAS